ncbi:MAG: hypothetical protein AAF153_00085 [Pseudomonadota bacterium]
MSLVPYFILFVITAAFIKYCQVKQLKTLMILGLITVAYVFYIFDMLEQKHDRLQAEVKKFQAQVRTEMTQKNKKLKQQQHQLDQNMANAGMGTNGSLANRVDLQRETVMAGWDRGYREAVQNSINRINAKLNLLEEHDYEMIKGRTFYALIGHEVGSYLSMNCWEDIQKEMKHLTDINVAKEKLAKQYSQAIPYRHDFGLTLFADKTKVMQDFVDQVKQNPLPKDQFALAQKIWHEARGYDIDRCRIVAARAIPVLMKNEFHWYSNGRLSSNNLTEMEDWYLTSQIIKLEQDVDFTVPLLLAHEIHEEIKFRRTFYGTPSHLRGSFCQGLKTIYDDVDKKLAELDPNNPGLQYNVLKYRQEYMQKRQCYEPSDSRSDYRKMNPDKKL